MYASQHLYLTAALQPLFIGMCVMGLRQWRATMRAAATAGSTSLAVA